MTFRPMSTQRRMPRAVNLLSPYQFVSQDTLQPGYEHNGFRDRESAEYWRERACGIACAQMLLYAHQGHLTPAGQLIEEGVALDAYRHGVGWIHSGLATLLTGRGLHAEAKLLPAEELIKHLLGGGTAILSVTPSLGVTRPPPEARESRGGHLVLCHGFSVPNGREDSHFPLAELLISDPDHEFPDRLEGSLAPFDRIDRAWSGRCIAIASSQTTMPRP